MALLKQYETDFGVIRVTRDARDGTLAYYQNGSFHSQANAQGISVCAYVHIIHEIVRQKCARNILIIGCAGGTLATMLRKLDCHVTVVDINSMAFVIARNHFKMPHDVRCVRRDGIEYLRITRKTYDAVIVDVFGSNNSVPRPFTTKSFFERVRRVLSSRGVMIMNVITADDKDMRGSFLARRAWDFGFDLTLFDWPKEKDRNTLLVAGKIKHVRIPSGMEPRWMRKDFHGLIRRKPRLVLRRFSK